MLFLWLATFAAAVSPQIHRLVHPDAASATHFCLLTQVRHGSMALGVLPVVAPAPPALQMWVVRCPDAPVLSSFDYRLSPSRAPPTA
jgi:hypothetical protein